MNDVREVANYALDRAAANSRAITNMSINKIIYFAHGWHLRTFSEPLVSSVPVAWQYGPVFRELYQEFRTYGSDPISGRARRMNFAKGVHEVAELTDAPEKSVKLLDQCVDVFGRLTAATLVSMSHVPGGPWDRAYNHTGRVNVGMEIPNDAIKDFFERRTEEVWPIS